MRQDPHEFIIDTKWKTATPENYGKERPVVPIKAISVNKKITQEGTAHIPIRYLQEMLCSRNW